MQLAGNIKPTVSDILRELRAMKNIGQFTDRVNTLENFLAEFQKLIEFPKLVRIRGK